MAAQFKMALMFLLAARALCADDNDGIPIDELEDNPSRRSWQYLGPPETSGRRSESKETGQSIESLSITYSPETATRTNLSTTTSTTPTEVLPTRTTSTTTTITSTTTTTTTPILPPLDPRYRRIYNSDETAKIEDHPYLAAILMNNQLWCGGAIISSDLVLTAAHCLQLQYNNRFFREYVKMLTVRIGSSNATAGGEVLRVDEIFFHPNYKPSNLAFNYAVVRLHKNITFSALNASKIQYSKRRDVTIDKMITFLGWGSVLGMGDRGGAVLLQKVDLPVYDKADCTEIYGRELVSVCTFCAGYISKIKNVCNHDAGGPAIMDGELIGILSFSAKRCNEADKPAVFAGTGAAAEWLDSIPSIRQRSDELAHGWMNEMQ